MTEHWPRWYIITGPWVIGLLVISLTAWFHDSLTWMNMVGMIDAAIWAYGMLVSLSEGALSIMFYAIAQEAKRRKKERKRRKAADKELVRLAVEYARENPDTPIEDSVSIVLGKRTIQV